MIASRTSLRRIGWAVLLAICCAVLFAMSLRVNALRSEVRRTEGRIVALRHETMYLETEYETRSNQQQLSAWNAVDFGYVAPNAGQYLENVRTCRAGQTCGPWRTIADPRRHRADRRVRRDPDNGLAAHWQAARR